MTAKTVLVVEDDAMTRMNAATLISEAGLDVVEMDSADRALAYVWRQPNDVAAIFSDVEMPGHTSGADLARTVSHHWPHIRLLITSGSQPEAMHLPASTTFFPKPWLPLDVLTAVQAAVEGPVRRG